VSSADFSTVDAGGKRYWLLGAWGACNADCVQVGLLPESQPACSLLRAAGPADGSVGLLHADLCET
jgi:hypothetical protein